MADPNDSFLLREYAEHQSESAFGELVQRHINFVYSVALRYVGHPADAQDVAQAVFVILARKSAGLCGRTTLTGWLYETTRLTARQLLRTKTRRLTREQEAYMQSTLDSSGGDPLWHQLAPHLEEAMSRLRAADRELLALRFYENKTGEEAALLLGIRAAAAHKRTNRALDKLQKFFAARGVTSTTAAISGAVSSNAMLIAPTGLVKTISAIALAKGATVSTSTLTLAKGALKIMAWTKAKIAIAAGVGLLLVAGTATTITIYQAGKPMRIVQSDWSVLVGDEAQWDLSHGIIKARSINGDSILSSSEEYGDFTFSVVAGTANREASLAFRMQDANNGYLVIFSPGTSTTDPAGFIRLIKRVSGNEIPITADSRDKRKLLRNHNYAAIKVVAKGPLILVFVNGSKVLDATDTTFTTGYLGLRIYGQPDWPCDATFSQIHF